MVDARSYSYGAPSLRLLGRLWHGTLDILITLNRNESAGYTAHQPLTACSGARIPFEAQVGLELFCIECPGQMSGMIGVRSDEGRFSCFSL